MASATSATGLTVGWHLQLVQAPRPKRVDAGVMPDVGARTAVAPELDVVEMGFLAHTEHADELVLAAVERALAGVGLHPDHQIQHLTVDHAASLEQLADMAPVHAHEMDGAVARHRRGRRQVLLQEPDEVGARELAGCHGEFAVLDPAATDDVTDADIVGRVQEGHRGAGVPHQASEVVGVARIAAQQAVMAQFPEIARLAHRSAVVHSGSTVSAGSDGSSSKSVAS